MPINSKTLSLIKNKLKSYLKDKRILDMILFGSIVKGKSLPNDIDIAFITNENIQPAIENFHISILKPSNFFVNPPTLINTLLREGYSLKFNKPFSQRYSFSNKVLFVYSLKGLSASKKVKIVNILRGKNKEKGMVEENNGEWVANQVFLCPIGAENLFVKFLANFNINFKKSYILIH